MSWLHGLAAYRWELLFIIGIAMFALIGCEATPAPPTATPTPAPAITAAQLYQELENNTTRFDLQYKGKWVRITGIVWEVDDGAVKLLTGPNTNFIDLGHFIQLNDLPREDQAKADKGEPFTATCKVGNYDREDLGNIIVIVLRTLNLDDCVL